MGFMDKVRAGAEQAAVKARQELDEFQAKRELKDAYAELGEAAFALIESRELTDERLSPAAGRVREAKADIEAAAPSPDKRSP